MKPKQWTKVVLSVPQQYQELLIGSLTSLGFNGFLQEDSRLTCFLEKHQWTKHTEAALRQTLGRFQQEFPHIEARYARRTVKEQNWNATWKRSIGVIEATNRIIIKPSWKKARSKDRGKIVLHIDPKMSFGTGHHESTRLCLILLERFLNRDCNVLDVGTGTGILAIAAAKLGARRIVALDNDEWSVNNAKENIRKNHVSNKVRVVQGSVDRIPKQKFDLVLANLDYPTVAHDFKKLLTAVRLEGMLILSGLLTSDLDPLLDLLKHHSAIPLEVVEENEWVALALLNSHAR